MLDLKELKERADNAMNEFRQTVRKISKPELTASETYDITHDNVKIIRSNSNNFSFLLQKEKQQVVVVLRGIWRLEHGGEARELSIAEIVRVPMGSPFDTLMHTEDPDAKFVYVQFK